jgi:tetratricopeptide (TPR) repeat protein
VPHPSKRPASSENEFPPGSVLGFFAERSQLDFEVEFFAKVLAGAPLFAEALAAQAMNLTTKGRLQDGLTVDKKLVAIRPTDPTAHYNLACRYALLHQSDLAFRSLRKAIELGYRDFRFMEEDRDLESIRKDPRFRQLVKEYRARRKKKG